MENTVLLAQEAEIATGIAGVGFICIIIVAGIIGLVVNFIPTIVAAMRGHRNTAVIFLLNLFLGWSFIGWVVAMVWALTDD